MWRYDPEKGDFGVAVIFSFIGATLALSIAVGIILYCFIHYPALFLAMDYVELVIWIAVYSGLYYLCKKVRRHVVRYALISLMMLIHAGYMLYINNHEISESDYYKMGSIDPHFELDALILYNRYLKDGEITIAEFRAVQNKRQRK